MADRFHRIRHYQGRFSNFDLIEPCKKPKPCWACEYKHPFCDETGRVEAAALRSAGIEIEGEGK